VVPSFISKISRVLGVAAFFCLFSLHAYPEQVNINLGGRGISGSFFPTAGTIASAVNRNSGLHDLQVSVKSRQESASIIHDVISGTLDFGVARMSHIFQAFNGMGEWERNPQKHLRSVLNTSGELVALIASVTSEIKTVDDLRGRRVFIGTAQSSLSQTVTDILAASGINPVDDLTIIGGATEEAPGMLIDREIDAFFYIIGITNRSFLELMSDNKQIRFISLAGHGIDEMIENDPFYEKARLGGYSQPFGPKRPEAQVVNVKKGLITTSNVNENVTYILTREVFSNIGIYAKQHPAARILTNSEMTKDMAAPVHSGAVKYFLESGIIYNVLKQ